MATDTASTPLALGLVDRLGRSDDTPAEGLAYAHELLAAGAPVRRTRDARGLADRDASRAALDAARADVAGRSGGLFSPKKTRCSGGHRRCWSISSSAEKTLKP